jgi:hypothetical protein
MRAQQWWRLGSSCTLPAVQVALNLALPEQQPAAPDSDHPKLAAAHHPDEGVSGRPKLLSDLGQSQKTVSDKMVGCMHAALHLSIYTKPAEAGLNLQRKGKGESRSEVTVMWTVTDSCSGTIIAGCCVSGQMQKFRQIVEPIGDSSKKAFCRRLRTCGILTFITSYRSSTLRQ